MINALLKEIELQKDYLAGEQVETIYFGGGTPSLLAIEDFQLIIDAVKSGFKTSPDAEITLEANPDDITDEKLAGWKRSGLNRLSIGVQSFFEEDLKWMNRAHNAKQAIDSLRLAIQEFDNITMDLIYGYPLLTYEKWKQNVQTAIKLNIPHLSCYALTVEPKTRLMKMINENKSEGVDADTQAEHFILLMEWLEGAGYEHYEISNFSKPGFRSRHNSSYWQGKKYLGLGPAAHSYDGNTRQWNIANNNSYIKAISNNNLPFEKEMLTQTQKINEYIMTSLRTVEGLALSKIPGEFKTQLLEAGKKFIDSGKLILKNEILMLTKEGKLFADGIASDLFIV